jgi:chromosome partitioning protein
LTKYTDDNIIVYIVNKRWNLELVGLSEVAEMAGVSRQAVVNWRARFSDFPSPTAELASGPVWIREDIENG